MATKTPTKKRPIKKKPEAPEYDVSAAPTFSASRIGTISKCGLAYQYQYVDKIPRPEENSALLFGNVIHNAVEAWYGSDDDPNDHTKTSLMDYVHLQWADLLPESLWEHVKRMVELNKERDNVAAAILFKRPTLKSPTTTKEFVESGAHQAFLKARDEMVEQMDIIKTFRFAKDENPFQGYMKSMAMATRMQERWQPLPRPLVVEAAFNIEIGDFRVRGRIDQIRQEPNEDGEEIKSMVDMKTGRNAQTAMEAFIQSYLYWEAIQQMPEEFRTNNVGFYYVRHDGYKQGKIDPIRHRKMAQKILRARAKQIIEKEFEPNHGFWCARCDYADICSADLGLFQSEDVQVELVPA